MYRKELDGLRAIAIIAVILNHIKQGLFPNGYLGVDMFFVLSGFVITKSLLEKEKMEFFPFLKNFWIRRSKRLFPALFVVVATTVLVTFLFSSYESHHTNMTIETGLFSIIGVGNLYLASTATDYFSTTAELNAFTHTWSLGVEEQFYLLFPILFWILVEKTKKKKIFILLLVLLTILSLLFFLKHFYKNPIRSFYYVHSRFWELSIGSLIFLFSHQSETLSERGKKIISNLSYILLPILISALLVFLFDSKYPKLPEKYYNLVVVCFTAGALFFSNSKSSIINLLQWKPITFLGLLSYSLYLWHWPVITFFRWTFGVKNNLIPIILIVCFSFAYISYRYIETPLRNSEWKWFNQKGFLSPITISISTAIGFFIFVYFILYPFYQKGSFYLGSTATLQSKGVHNLLSPVSHRSDTWNPIDCVLTENNQVGKKISTENCSFGKEFKGKRKFLVLGNSYSAAQVYMFQTIAEKGGTVTVTSTWGGSPAPNLSFNGKWDKINDYYWKDVVPELMSELKPNDVILMIYDLYDFLDSETRLQPFGEELSKFLIQCKEKNLKVIFQHSLPAIRESNCNPDLAIKQWWHQFQDPPCLYFSKEETLNRRKPLHEKLLSLKEEHSNFYILDLMDLFCPENECRFINQDGKFLYRDEFSHPSIEASILARTSLWQVIQKIN
ncbi:acyltransferase [Leptospira congkakensis]|uniref:Acyltransferase n=1 Tax=Leptospira congkakensis TaxID=2484932 RepID=A0A4Z1AFQ9_9LEPT|nr:acyltransferase family protein [Leptospira congkakensis]TGL90218.1 acyltransferase [Leptospira congkakensis]TGL91224.1 acyltransferase [Leptospira congkakensis]TGL98276.1 acyltransferase [Leptospira congkakensis]